MKNLSKNIKFLRKRAQWSQEELASRLQVKRSNIAAYESKNVTPRLEFIMAFSKLFDISISDLIEKDLQERGSDAAMSDEPGPAGIEPSQVRLEPLQAAPPSTRALDLDDKDSVRQFVQRSARIRKMLEGFQAFYRLKLENLQDAGRDAGNLAADIENFFLLMEHLLAHNETAVRAIAQKQGIKQKM